MTPQLGELRAEDTKTKKEHALLGAELQPLYKSKFSEVLPVLRRRVEGEADTVENRTAASCLLTEDDAKLDWRSLLARRSIARRDKWCTRSQKRSPIQRRDSYHIIPTDDLFLHG